ncbi:Vacuolar fusion protein CCZ1-like protein [Operophtera brumata]|uniref:Vacuolar fusion protein CCZ1-like protein n=1 Tax=Operophtera brumata TaxID=104452 RepID=A0A0L7KX59_OPEBR|nr:Vacuolar fusion protein CCZ1-like protein [Operophtera brumata]
MIDIGNKISAFFVFNSSFGPREGDELKRILFYHPSNIGPDARKMQTQTKRYIFYQPEKGYWMVLIHPSVMYELLLSAYKMFHLFRGPFKDISTEEIYSKCEQFFLPFITSKKFTNDVSDVVQGINYLPLDKNSFFSVLCFIDLLEVNHPDFKCVSFVYNEQLIWNNLSTSDMLTLYQYLVQTLLPQQVEREIQGGPVAAAERHGRFISPPEGIRTKEDLNRVIKVHLKLEDDTEMRKTLELETLKSLDAFMGPQLSTIASSISEQCTIHALQRAQLASSEHNLGNYGEIIIKTPDEYWITGKSSNEREFYVIIQEKNANLKEISDEVKRICEAQMKGIFFYPI